MSLEKNKEILETSLCECGCCQEVKKGHRFVHGHNMRGKHHNQGKIPWNKGLTKKDDIRVAKQGNYESHFAWNKGLTKETDVRVKQNSINMKKGILRGFANGRVSWIKGLTKETDKSVKKISEKLVGKKLSKSHVSKISGGLKLSYKLGRIIHWSKGYTKDTHSSVKKISEKMIGRKFSAKHLAALRKARLGQVLPRKDTTIEVIIQSKLKQLEIVFEKHVLLLNKYQVDILIKELVVECDGDYWHNFPDGLKKDRIRDKELKSAGYKVLRFWGHDIKNNSENCINKILEQLPEI